MPQNYSLFPLSPVDDGALSFKIAANVLRLPGFHPTLVMLTVELVAHVDHGLSNRTNGIQAATVPLLRNTCASDFPSETLRLLPCKRYQLLECGENSLQTSLQLQ